MKTLSKLIMFALTFPLMACSTYSQTFFTRPVIEDVPGGFNTLSLTADRRVAIFKSDKTDPENPIGLMACAEALPDVALSSTVESELKATIEAAGKGELDAEAAEKLTQALTVAYQRTEKSDLVRQLGWQLCQGFLNGAVSNDDYRRLLEMMVVSSLIDPNNDGSPNIAAITGLLGSAAPRAF